MIGLFESPTADALISSCGRYRYWLTRQWSSDPSVCFVMLNPSTADAAQDDPTIRRCIGFAKAWGYGRLVVVNLFALRATDPKQLMDPGDVVGPDNDGHILASTEGRMVVAAWGCHKRVHDRARYVMRLLEGRDVRCLGTTKYGRPKHPLYVKADTVPIKFQEAGKG